MLGLDIGALGPAAICSWRWASSPGGDRGHAGAVAGRAAGPGLRLVGGGVAVALSLMGCDILDANADIETTYVHALVFAVAAILLAQAPGGGR